MDREAQGATQPYMASMEKVEENLDDIPVLLTHRVSEGPEEVLIACSDMLEPDSLTGGVEADERLLDEVLVSTYNRQIREIKRLESDIPETSPESEDLRDGSVDIGTTFGDFYREPEIGSSLPRAYERDPSAWLRDLKSQASVFGTYLEMIGGREGSSFNPEDLENCPDNWQY